ncbi:hypothetical protein [Streptomyces sp. NPDC005012]|uniref:hypothetical protein n=1 Tax=Streptomyces sp. NPDC005012 TaxID=3154558 RepID=UPI0033AD066F
MPSSADQLLEALEPLSFPAGLRLTATTARDLARQGDGALAELLTELDARGAYERRLAALAAFAGRDAAFLTARLADPDEVVARYAHRAARTLPVPDEAVEAAYRDAPDALRHRLAALIVSGPRTGLAERLLPRLRQEWGDHEAARLLRGCSTPFVARHLPALAHAVRSWPALARRHPDAVLDHLAAEPGHRSAGRERENWWREHAPTLTALAAARPGRVMDLLERHGPASIPVALHPVFPALVTADADRLARWLVAPEREPERGEPALPPGVLRKLVRAERASLVALARHWAHRSTRIRPLLKALPPAARPAFLDEARGGGSAWEGLDVLPLLPRERRHAEVRRLAALFDPDDLWWETLDTLAHGAYDEAREELLAAVRRREAGDRELAWPPFVRAATLDGGEAAVTELLTVMGSRLRNDQDPVRRAALEALADARPTVFTAAHAPLLRTIATDALQARDASAGTRDALRLLATRVLAAHATAPGPAPASADTHATAPASATAPGPTAPATPDAPRAAEARSAAEPPRAAEARSAAEPPRAADALRGWALATLERLTGRTGAPDFGPLHRVLRRGQEHEVLDTLRPWLDAAADRADFGLLLGLAAALGPRARRMPELQDRLVTALERGDDDTFRTAVELWLADPRTRDGRVEALLRREPSAAVLPPVLAVLSRRRTDLLDVLLGEEPPYGRFLTPDARRPLPDLAHGGRWLPRRQRAAARLAERTAADPALPLDERAAVIRAAAPLPELGARLALRHVDDPEVVLAEAALAALPWTDRPEDALPVLLEQAGTDRARVAVYAAARAARFTAPSALGPSLGAVLTGQRPAKVTSRKEAARLAARFLPPGQAGELLAGAFGAEDSQADVRAAIVRVLPALAGEASAWEVLADSGRDAERGVRSELFALRPWEFAEEHRRRFAVLLGEAYDTHLTTGLDLPPSAADTLAAWVRHDAAMADRLSRTVCDLVGGARSVMGLSAWSFAADALFGIAASELPHPLGGAAEGSVLHTTVTRLLSLLHTPEGGHEALERSDLPALQRLRRLWGTTGRHDGITRTLTDLFAQEPLLAFEHAQLVSRRVDLTARPDVLLAALSELADALEPLGVQAAVTVAGELARHRPARPGTAGEAGEGVAEAVRRLAGDGRTVTGLLAVTLTTEGGLRGQWPEEWRDLLRTLRRHPDPDVRHLAHRTFTARE